MGIPVGLHFQLSIFADLWLNRILNAVSLNWITKTFGYALQPERKREINENFLKRWKFSAITKFKRDILESSIFKFSDFRSWNALASSDIKNLKVLAEVRFSAANAIYPAMGIYINKITSRYVIFCDIWRVWNIVLVFMLYKHMRDSVILLLQSVNSTIKMLRRSN